MSADDQKCDVKFTMMPKSCAKQSPGSLFNQLFTGYQGGGVVVSEPGGMLVGTGYVHHAEKIYNFKVRPDDVWIVTQPKCGI